MTNVRRPVHLQLQRPANATMVSSSSGPSPFGGLGTGSGGSSNSANQLLGVSAANAQQSPPQPAPRSTPIRPTALNCIGQTPTLAANLASPMQARLMMSSPQVSASSPRSTEGGAQRPTCLSFLHDTNTRRANYSCQQQQQPQQQQQQQQQQQSSKAPLSPTGSLPSQIMPHLFVGDLGQTNRETINKLNIKYILSLGLLPMIMSNNNGSSTTSVTTLSPISTAPIGKRASSKQKGHHHQPQHNNHHNHHAPHQTQQQQHLHHNHHHNHLMPERNSSRDFKIRIRSNTPTTPTTPNHSQNLTNTNVTQQQANNCNTPLEQGACLSSTTTTPAATVATPAVVVSAKPRDENKGIKQVRSIYCKCININDSSEQSLSKFFDETYMFIEGARRKKCNILIHCLAGISRSPAIAISYLMRLRSMHWRDAFELVRQCRPQIDPNISFICQLSEYNKSLGDERSAIANKRNSNSNLNDNSLTPDDCHHNNAIENSKPNCCIDLHHHHHHHINHGNTLVGHEPTNATANLRDKDNI